MKTNGNPNFLQSVAQYYAQAALGRVPAENVVYVLPNKRSALFLKHYVRQTVDGVALMPRFMTMRTFLSLHSPYPEGEAMEQLFILYDAYRQVMEARGKADAAREFDSFIFWGEMILSDFDDIDRSLVNAADLFRNLRNVKEIQADYLDEDQKEVIRRIWGESRLTAETDRFWLHVTDEDSEESVTARFLYLWQILGDLYTAFHSLMDRRHISSAGAQYRAAVETVRKMSRDDFDGLTHYAFVGFNDLCTAETLIFDRLRALGVASFFWDTAPLVLGGAEAAREATPLRRLGELARHFPAPHDYSVPLPAEAPELRVIAVPSNAGQAKAINSVLASLGEEMAPAAIDTAVVLPDQNLLVPALMSVPANIGSVNISMGLPYRTTAFSALLHSIVSMQLRSRNINGQDHFFYADVEAVLTHSYIMTLAGSHSDRLRNIISAERLYNIPSRRLVEEAPELKAVFTPVRSLDSVLDVADYLRDLLDWLGAAMSGLRPDGNASGFELGAIAYFRSQVDYLARLIEEHSVRMSDRTFLNIFEKVFNSRGLTVNGTPLRGLQILGVLETRALDFDNVVILSMNEGIFPRKQYTRTMIPNSLRRGYGLPDFESLEWTYAYCFYRLMARARKAWLFYDSRADGLGGGEMSRYISQLHYLMPGVDVRFDSLAYGACSSGPRRIMIEKSDDVFDRLRQYFPGGRLRLSASAIKDYRNCPLSFYLKYVCSMRGSDDIVDYISAAQYGNAVHTTIQELISPYAGMVVDKAVLSQFSDPYSASVKDAARRAVVAERYRSHIGREQDPLPAEGEIAIDIVAAIAAADMRAEADFYCRPDFIFRKNEWKLPEGSVWRIDDTLSVNFYMSVDRIDSIDATTLRFIDFKTGDEKTSVAAPESLFAGKYSHDQSGIMQLLIYCEAYRSIVSSDTDIVPVLHPLRDIVNGAPLSYITIGGEEVKSYAAVASDVRPLIHAMIHEIFDRDVPFVQCDDVNSCRFCPFLRLCGRVLPENSF